jgi:hypothetical protein
MGVQVPREKRHARDLDETEVERDQLVCFSALAKGLPNGQEVC